MKKIILILTCLFCLSFTACCNKNAIPTITFAGVWKASIIKLNNVDPNLASSGQPYANFTLDIQGETDEKGSYTMKGMPQPFSNTYTGNWRKDNNTFVFESGAPEGITTLQDFALNGEQLTFVMVQQTSKTGELKLHCTLVR